MKKTTGTFCAALLWISLAACSDSGGSESGGDYCETLKSSQSVFAGLDPTTLTEEKFSALQDKIKQLEDAAPSEVRDDWGTAGEQIDKFKGLLDEASLDFDDIQTLKQNKMPEGVDMAKLQALIPKLQQFLQDPSLDNAAGAIRKNAKSECNITLDG
jgi:hypothetical protein